MKLPIMQFFKYSHLPEHLQEISKPFFELADQLVLTLPHNVETRVALRKLLESKDAAVRSAVLNNLKIKPNIREKSCQKKHQ